MKIVSSKVSKTLKEKYKIGELVSPNKGKKVPFKAKCGQKVENLNHSDAIKKEILEYKNQGFRCIEIGNAYPDFIAIKDNKVYAIEVEFHSPKYEKYNNIKCYDDIIWIRYRRIGKP